MNLLGVDPTRYFENVEMCESELLRFCFDPTRRTLDIIVNYAANVVSEYFQTVSGESRATAQRLDAVELHWLNFACVTDLSTKLGLNVPADKVPLFESENTWFAHELLLTHPRGRVITAFDCNCQGSDFTCFICLDSFGSHKWNFAGLRAAQQQFYVVRHSGRFVFREFNSGVAFDPWFAISPQATVPDNPLRSRRRRPSF